MGFDLDRAFAGNDCEGQIKSALWIDVWRRSVKFEAELGSPGWRRLNWLWYWQRPLRRWPLDKQINRLACGRGDNNGDQRLCAGIDASRGQPRLHSRDLLRYSGFGCAQFLIVRNTSW